MMKITPIEGQSILGWNAEFGNMELNDMCKTLDDLREVINNHRSENKSKDKIYASDELLERCTKILFAFIQDSHALRSEFDKIDIERVLNPKR